MTVIRVKRVPRGRNRTPKEVESVATNLSKWDPFRDLLGIQNEMTRLFDRVAGDDGGTLRAWSPPMDIAETADGYRIVAELPGFSPDQVDVTVTDGVLTIKGERKFYSDVDEGSFHRVERRFGAFQRSVTLPSAVQADKIGATFDKGVLTVEVPKAEVAKPRRIQIEAR